MQSHAVQLAQSSSLKKCPGIEVALVPCHAGSCTRHAQHVRRTWQAVAHRTTRERLPPWRARETCESSLSKKLGSDKPSKPNRLAFRADGSSNLIQPAPAECCTALFSRRAAWLSAFPNPSSRAFMALSTGRLQADTVLQDLLGAATPDTKRLKSHDQSFSE